MRLATYLVVSHVIIRAHSLYLHGTKHPADVIDDLDIGRRGLKSKLSIKHKGQLMDAPSSAEAVWWLASSALVAEYLLACHGIYTTLLCG